MLLGNDFTGKGRLLHKFVCDRAMPSGHSLVPRLDPPSGGCGSLSPHPPEGGSGPEEVGHG